MKFQDVIAAIPSVAALRDVRLGAAPEIQRVSEDSRRVQPGDLFVARSGTKVSGAEFAAQAVARGAVAVIADQTVELPPAVAYGRVDRANLALAFMAQRLAGEPAQSMKCLAVTGTKGKTTITYLLRAIFHAAGARCGLIGTVQLDDGVEVVPSEMTTPGPLELAALMARMRDNHAAYCVMEVSSHALHQDRVAGIDFAVGMFTNLTGDHLDYHKTMESYAEAKAILFDRLSPSATAVINADDAWAKRMQRDCRASVVNYQVVAPGRAELPGGWTAQIQQMTSRGMRLLVHGPDGRDTTLETPLVGRHNAYNVLCVIAAAAAVGIEMPVMAKVLRSCVGAPGRLQPVVPASLAREQMPFQVFVDYAHTHDALENVLTAVRATMNGRGGRLICVFGCGGDRDRTKRPKMAAVAERLADRVVVTSDNPRTEDPLAILREIQTGFSRDAGGKVIVEPDRRKAIVSAVAMAGETSGDVVVIAGKGHENYQIIGKTKHHFDDVEEALAALRQRGIGA